jgi:hypothetical protein
MALKLAITPAYVHADMSKECCRKSIISISLWGFDWWCFARLLSFAASHSMCA